MAERLLNWRDLLRICRAFDIDVVKGKGSHFKFFRTLKSGRRVSFPIPRRNEVPKPYLRQLRQTLELTEEQGVSDEDFYCR